MALAVSGTVSYWNSCLSVIESVIETFVEAVVYQLLKQLFISYLSVIEPVIYQLL